MRVEGLTVDDREAREREFHDEWARGLAVDDVLVDVSWEAATSPEHRWIKGQLGDIEGQQVLDLGCGAGEAAVWFAKQGAEVVAVDLSPAFIELVDRVARHHGVSVETKVADVQSLELPSGSFDIVYAGNLLHHLDLDTALPQIAEVLRPGGRFFSWDPLKHNFAINVYRRLASGVRTPDESPLSIQDLEKFGEHFEEVRYEFFWLTALWIFVRFFFIERVKPSEERYWKKIISEHERLSPTYNRLERLDRWILKRVPALGRYCWNVVVAARKAGINPSGADSVAS